MSFIMNHLNRAPFVGGIAINIVDDLVIVHHQVIYLVDCTHMHSFMPKKRTLI